MAADVSRVIGSVVASTEVERYKEVDTEDVPSARWGWSGTAPNLWMVVLLLIAAFLLLMLRGNHVGWVENWYLIGIAATLVAIVARQWFLRRRGRIR